jgi:hypothetical protein
VGDTAGRFEGSYWAGWIEDFMMSSDTNLKGFYWTLENAWMFKEDQIQKQAGISFSIIRDMAESIHNNGFEFIWIPSACTLNLAGTNIFPMGTYPGAFEFFDYVFVQPNYYQKSIISDGKHIYRYNYEKLVECGLEPLSLLKTGMMHLMYLWKWKQTEVSSITTSPKHTLKKTSGNL